MHASEGPHHAPAPSGCATPTGARCVFRFGGSQAGTADTCPAGLLSGQKHPALSDTWVCCVLAILPAKAQREPRKLVFLRGKLRPGEQSGSPKAVSTLCMSEAWDPRPLLPPRPAATEAKVPLAPGGGSPGPGRVARRGSFRRGPCAGTACLGWRVGVRSRVCACGVLLRRGWSLSAGPQRGLQEPWWPAAS